MAVHVLPYRSVAAGYVVCRAGGCSWHTAGFASALAVSIRQALPLGRANVLLIFRKQVMLIFKAKFSFLMLRRQGPGLGAAEFSCGGKVRQRSPLGQA